MCRSKVTSPDVGVPLGTVPQSEELVVHEGSQDEHVAPEGKWGGEGGGMKGGAGETFTV